MMEDLIDKEDYHDRLIMHLDSDYNLGDIEYDELSEIVNNAINECVDRYSKTFVDEDGNVEIDDWDMFDADIKTIVLNKLGF